MTVTQPPLDRDFGKVANAWMRNRALSWKAKGVLAYIAGHAESYTLTLEQMIDDGADGRDVVRSALRELEAAGFLRRVPIRGYRGRLVRYDYQILDPDQVATGDGSTACGPTGGGPTACGKPAPSHDQGGRGESPAGTGDGFTAGGEPPTEKTTPPTGEKTTEKTMGDRATRGTRLPESWTPSPPLIDWFAQELLPGGRWSAETREAVRREHAKFADHWRAAPGQKGVKKDWDATWRNWMRRAFPVPSASIGSKPSEYRTTAERNADYEAKQRLIAQQADVLLEQDPTMDPHKALAQAKDMVESVAKRPGVPYIDAEVVHIDGDQWEVTG